MRAYARLILTCEGPPPEEVESMMVAMGYQPIEGALTYVKDIEPGAFDDLVSELHHGLAGTKARYIPSVRLPEELRDREAMGYTARLEAMRPLGMDVDALSDLIEDDPGGFRASATEMFNGLLDRMMQDRERELEDLEAKRRLERIRQGVLDLAAEGASVSEMMAALGMGSDILYGLLEDLVQKGMVTAEQRGRTVVYVRPG